MSKPFAIVTDTGHNIPPDIVRDLKLREVPFTINFGVQGSVDDGVLELGEFTALQAAHPVRGEHPGAEVEVADSQVGKRAVGVVWEEKG